MENIFPLTLSVISCLASVFVTWQYLTSRHQREFEERDQEMAGELETSFATYCDLEQRVVRILKSMKRKEHDFNQRLNIQRENICTLQDALSAHESRTARSEEPNEPEEMSMEDSLEPLWASFDDSQLEDMPSDTEDLGLFVDEFDRQSDENARVQIEAIEEQTRAIAKLTVRTAELEPLATSLSRQEREIEGWKRLHEELSLTNRNQVRLLQQCLEEFQPIANGLNGQEQLVERWQEKLAEAEQGAQARISELESRVVELEPRARELVEREQELREREQELSSLRTEFSKAQEQSSQWQEKFEGSEQEFHQLREQTNELRECMQHKETEISGLHGEMNERDGQIRELQTAIGVAANKVEDLSHDLDNKRDEIALLDSSLANATSGMAELESQLQSKTNECETLRTELEAARDRLQTLERQYADACEQLDQKAAQAAKQLEEVAHEKDELQDILDQVEAAKRDLESELAETSVAVSSQAERIEALQSSLAEVSGDAASQRNAVLEKMSTFQEAQTLLEAMRPMFEGLESKLRPGEKNHQG